MWALSVINVGFSLMCAPLLFACYVFFLKSSPRSYKVMVPCIVLLSGLSCLQAFHFHFFTANSDPLADLTYRFVLFVVPPTFYFFSRSILLPSVNWQRFDLLHCVPSLAVFFLPTAVAVPLAFGIGVTYCFWLCSIVYKVRRHRKRFSVELFFYGFFAILAVLVLFAGFLTSFIERSYFYYFYANGIALAYFLVLGSFIVYPDLLAELEEVGSLSYASSTLTSIDTQAKKLALLDLMEKDKFFQNENTNLTLVARALEMNSHQLSELVNVEFGMGFSRFIKEQRIRYAKELLLRDQDCAILAISMELGFKSQSNFYAAFKEITGTSPGQFRKASARS